MMKSKAASGRNKRKHHSRQNPITRWLLVSGILLILAASVWLIISNQQSSNGQKPISQLSTNDFHSLIFSPTEPDTVFFGHHNGLMVSHNGGKDWQPTTLSNVDAMALAVPLSSPEIMYAAGHGVFFKSTNSGKTWQSVSTNLPGSHIHGFTVDPDNANIVYAEVAHTGIFGSQDGGKTWTQLSANAPGSIFNLTMGENSRTLYAAAMNAGLWRSTDGGQTWANISNTPGEGVISLTYSPSGKRLFITTLGKTAGLYASTDGGSTWVSAGLTGIFMAVTVSPGDPNHLIAVDENGRVYASQDGGKTWPGN